MPAGYSLLGSLMGAHPEIATFRRFGALNALNLLYMQAELISLENGLHKQAKSDAESGHFDRSIYYRDWQTLSESVTTEDGDPTQWRTMLKVKEKLSEYNQALYLQHMVAKFGPPGKQDFKFLQTWMKTPSMGNVYLLGSDSDVWDNFDAEELVCLKPNKANSLMARFCANTLVKWYHHLLGHRFRKPDTLDIHQDTVFYSQEGVLRFSMLIGTVFASLLLVGSIVVLYSIDNMTTRLVIIGVFTATFSLGLGLLTNGKIVEIFSATAAFAAVQVVFVSSTNSVTGS
ncbi:hypothetical protein F5Y13DRAFT_191142 [Hypoxylon sp. FL1857]|nr:hypothetical protein F5Y13DRAFT_191142 [Hypoxylon sp. FL1857]